MTTPFPVNPSSPPVPLPPETLMAHLRQRGLRVTPQRLALYANLRQRQDHPTAEDLCLTLQEEGQRVVLATVYNSLQALREVGLVREVLLEEGVSRYDANVAPHHHFRCRCCGHIEDLPWGLFGSLTEAVLRPGLHPERYEVTVQGVCDRCHPRPSAPPVPSNPPD